MKRYEYLDVIKAVAIIAVVLYHMGYIKYGYLGVDIFLVVNGFLLAKSFKELSTFRDGAYWLVKRVLRLYPLTLIATGVCLIWGSFWMLPYQYQDLSQSVIATDIFANNILMSIKSANYWNVLNDYKPLMHTWYLGIIVQFYICFSFILILIKKLVRVPKDVTPYIVVVCFIGSLILYILPNFTTSQKFYFLPFRVFEFCAGCMIAYWVKSKNEIFFQNKFLISIFAIFTYLLTLGLLFVNVEFVPASVKLLIIVALTCVLLATLPHVTPVLDKVISNKRFAFIGKASFSIYIWHQIVFAFYRYSFSSVFGIKEFVLAILITGLFAYVSYKYVEQAMAKYFGKEYGIRNSLIGCIFGSIVLISTSFYINLCSGVIRDVPELDTYVGKTSDRMHIAYNERVSKWDRDFTDGSKLHWLVLGTSYGRDWANVISEGDLDNDVEISYINTTKIPLTERIERLRTADMIFCTITEISVASSIKKIDEAIVEQLYICDSIGINPERIRIVGNKRFGECIGQVYAKRNNIDYYKTNVELDEEYFIHNQLMKEKYGERFIDILTPMRISKDSVRVFTDNKKIISQDTEHLTKQGSRYYAKIFRPLFLELIKEEKK